MLPLLCLPGFVSPAMLQTPPAPPAPPVDPDVAINELAHRAQFLGKVWTAKSMWTLFGASKINEDAKPLLPREFLALAEGDRAKALHPDTAILLISKLERAAAAERPEEAKSTDWMLPLLGRARQIGAKNGGYAGVTPNLTNPALNGGTISTTTQRGMAREFGPISPILMFRHNLSDPNPTAGLDKGSRIVQPDLHSRNWARVHSEGTWAPELGFPSDADGKVELERWVMARICISRAEGKWDTEEQRKEFLKVAVPLVPDWDFDLLSRGAKAGAQLKVPLEPRFKIMEE